MAFGFSTISVSKMIKSHNQILQAFRIGLALKNQTSLDNPIILAGY